jgi:D-alanyl-D-alanine carboxypeptidase
MPISVYAISTSATSAILMDTDNNRILYSENIHEQRSVASISKIMTAVIAIESGKLDNMVVVNDSIKKAYGSAIYISVGEELTLRDLLYGLMLRSGNDASLMIAKYVGGSIEEFVNMMNNKASELGMKESIFNNPNGLDENGGNISTAYDMAILTSYAMQLDEYKKIVSTKEYKLKTNLNSYVWINKNKLLTSYKYTTGGKTGYTEIAKRTLVTTASKDNINLVAVTLNDGNDFEDHKNLFEYAFNSYTNYQILKSGEIKIYDDDYYSNYKLYIKDSFNYTVSNTEKDNLKIKFNLDKKIVTEDEKVGLVEVYLNDEKIFQTDIYASKLEKKENKNIIKKISEWFKNLW